MKRKSVFVMLSLVLVLVLSGQFVRAQVPQTISYQGFLTDANGNVVPNGDYELAFRLYTSSTGGSPVWEEVHQNLPIQDGIFNAILGSITPLTLPFDVQYFLGISVEQDPELSPRIQLTSAGSSLIARTVEDGAITTVKLADDGVTLPKIAPDVVSSVEGVRNDGGDIDLVEGPNITITADDAANTITIEAAGGGGIGQISQGNAITVTDSTGPTVTVAVTLNAINDDEIQDESLTASSLAANSVGSSEIAANAVANSEIQANAVTTDKVAPNIVSSIDGVINDGGNIDLVAGANIVITPNDGANTITFDAVGGAGGITQIDAGNAIDVTNPNGPTTTIAVASNSINDDEVQDNSLTAISLAANSVESSEIATNAVGSSEIAPNAVGNSEIQANAVTTDKVAPDIVSSIDGVINDGGNIDLVAGTNITITPGGNTITIDATAAGGITQIDAGNAIDVTNPNGPTTTVAVASNSINDDEVQDNSLTAISLAANSVESSEIAADAVGSSEIAQSAVGFLEIAQDAVGSTHIQLDAVGSSEIQANAVGTSEIQNDAVTKEKILPDVVSSINGVSNDGGNIDLVAGTDITITPNDGANTITIAATGGGGGGITQINNTDNNIVVSNPNGPTATVNLNPGITLGPDDLASINIEAPGGGGILLAPLNGAGSIALSSSAGEIAVFEIQNGSSLLALGTDPFTPFALINESENGGGSLSLRNTNRNEVVRLNDNPANGGRMSIDNSSLTEVARVSTTTGGSGFFSIDHSSGAEVVRATTTGGGAGYFNVNNTSGTEIVRGTSNTSNGGFFNINNSSGSELVRLTQTSNGGFIAINNNAGTQIARLTNNSAGDGLIEVNNAAGSKRVELDPVAGTAVGGYGAFKSYNSSGILVNQVGGNEFGSGGMFTASSSGSNAVWVTTAASDQSSGFISIYSAGSQVITLDGSTGAIIGTTKMFRMDHPRDPDKEIYYVSLEGPEAGVYVRGSAKLVDGQARVKLPDHFSLVAVDKGLTVQLTPLSASSEGLAVVKKSTKEVVVRELRNGTGSYEFDYVVQAVRDGFEDFQVIRPKADAPKGAEIGFDRALQDLRKGSAEEPASSSPEGLPEGEVR